MPEVLPAILVKDALKFKEKIEILEGHAAEAQIDIMDGKFVGGITFSDLGQIRALKTSVQYELHLMVEDPETELVGWRDVANVKRVIVHAEIAKPLEPLITTIKSVGWQAGIALNPETSWQRIDELIPHLDTVLVMTVHPGKAGQPFGEAVPTYHLLNKIFELHEAHPGLTISVDGGVGSDTIPLLLEAGATRLVIGSALWKSKNPLAALKKLETIIQSF